MNHGMNIEACLPCSYTLPISTGLFCRQYFFSVAKNADGTVCHGDSGGPMMTKKNGSFFQIGEQFLFNIKLLVGP